MQKSYVSLHWRGSNQLIVIISFALSAKKKVSILVAWRMDILLSHFHNEFRFAWWDEKMKCEVIYEGMNSPSVFCICLGKSVCWASVYWIGPLPSFSVVSDLTFQFVMEVFSKRKCNFRVVCFELQWMIWPIFNLVSHFLI